MDQIRLGLSPTTLKVDCRDIYDNKITFGRSFKWFSRYLGDDDDGVIKLHSKVDEFTDPQTIGPI